MCVCVIGILGSGLTANYARSVEFYLYRQYKVASHNEFAEFTTVGICWYVPQKPICRH